MTKADAISVHMGALETSNERTINKMIVNQILPTCQLQMGMTELATGSAVEHHAGAHPQPAHGGVFLFRGAAKQAVCHFMGEPQETRHIWMHGDQAVLARMEHPLGSSHAQPYTSSGAWAARTWTMATRTFEITDLEINIIKHFKINQEMDGLKSIFTRRKERFGSQALLMVSVSTSPKAFHAAGIKNIIFNDVKQELVDRGLASYKEAGIEAHGYVCDVTNEDQVQALVKKIHEEVGQIDILVNNAGIIKRIPMHEMARKDFQQVIDIDLVGPFIVSKAVLPEMMEQGRQDHQHLLNDERAGSRPFQLMQQPKAV